MTEPTRKLIYKIVPEALWRDAERVGRFDGAPVDHADGYIHFSTAGQARETAARHFAGRRTCFSWRWRKPDWVPRCATSRRAAATCSRISTARWRRQRGLGRALPWNGTRHLFPRTWHDRRPVPAGRSR